jgi:glucan biosynthesis protein
MSTRTALAIAISVTAAAVTAGLLALGSPATARERRFDTKRVEHLAELSNAVNTYHLSNRRLPTALPDLEQELAYAVRFRDPATAQPYEYRVIDSDFYELCATFQQPSKGASRAWYHGLGRQCFKRDAQNKE